MYRFEIHDEEEGPDNGTRYRWELLHSDGGDHAEVVAQGRRHPTRTEAEAEVRAFRRGVAWARLEEPPGCLPDPGPATVTFRRLPNVVSLPVGGPGRHDRRAAEPAPGRHHLRVPAAGQASEGPGRPRQAPATPPAAESPGRRTGGRTTRGTHSTAKAT